MKKHQAKSSSHQPGVLPLPDASEKQRNNLKTRNCSGLLLVLPGLEKCPPLQPSKPKPPSGYNPVNTPPVSLEEIKLYGGVLINKKLLARAPSSPKSKAKILASQEPPKPQTRNPGKSKNTQIQTQNPKKTPTENLQKKTKKLFFPSLFPSFFPGHRK